MKNYIFVDTLGDLIQRYHPRTLLETGTHRGRSGCFMVEQALKHHPNVEYNGYDLFDMATDLTNKSEINGKGIGDFVLAQRRFENIQKQHPGFVFELHRGFTTQTLTSPMTVDLAYIDGGHSTATVLHDFTMVRDSRIIVFDDYQMQSVQEALRQAGIQDQIFVFEGKKTSQAIYKKS